MVKGGYLDKAARPEFARKKLLFVGDTAIPVSTLREMDAPYPPRWRGVARDVFSYSVLRSNDFGATYVSARSESGAVGAGIGAWSVTVGEHRRGIGRGSGSHLLPWVSVHDHVVCKDGLLVGCPPKTTART